MTEQQDHENEDEWTSKTQRKQECDALQKLGEQLTTLKINELDNFDLPDTLYAAIRGAHKIKQRGALKRHRQYIGKLMRDVDSETITKQLDKLRHKDDLNNAIFKRIEKLRDQIIEGGDPAINRLIDDYPQADRQYLRQLYRNIQKEQKQNKPPASARLLFKYIRELSENQS